MEVRTLTMKRPRGREERGDREDRQDDPGAVLSPHVDGVDVRGRCLDHGSL